MMRNPHTMAEDTRFAFYEKVNALLTEIMNEQPVMREESLGLWFQGYTAKNAAVEVLRRRRETERNS